MPTDNSSLSESLSETFAELGVAAVALNNVTDALGNAVVEIDESLKRFNLGIEVWEDIRHEHNDDTGMHWSLELGYARIGGKWGLSLRESEGDDPADLDINVWSYKDAPRSFRLEAVHKIPALLRALNVEAKKTTTELRAKLAEVQTVAAALKKSTGERTTRGMTRLTLSPEVTQAMGSYKPKPTSVDDQGGSK
jgi:hypothetical protein